MFKGISILEFQGWGRNWLTISFVITILFDAAEAWEVRAQHTTISDAGEAKSVSTIWFCYFGFLLIALGVYGAVGVPGQISIAMIGEGLLGAFFYLPMMRLLWKTRGYSSTEKKVLIGSAAMVPIVLLLPWSDFWVTLFSGGAVIAAASMPFQIYKNKSRGQVELGLTLVYLANVFFWMIYGFSARILPLMIVSPMAVVLLLITIVFWFAYPKRYSI